MDVVGGFLIADSGQAKALTGVDDHSRMCVSAKLITQERTRLVCDGLTAALKTFGVPEQILTDNGAEFDQAAPLSRKSHWLSSILAGTLLPHRTPRRVLLPGRMLRSVYGPEVVLLE
jgi:hypothetical protein